MFSLSLFPFFMVDIRLQLLNCTGMNRHMYYMLTALFISGSKTGIQLQTHPNIDKEVLRAKSQIGLKNPAKPFPLNTDDGVLKWQFQVRGDLN